MNKYSEIVIRFTDGKIDESGGLAPRFVHPIETINNNRSPNLRYDTPQIQATSPSETLPTNYKRMLSFMKYATRWWPANPNKEIIKIRLSDTYHLLQADQYKSNAKVCNYFNASTKKHNFDDIIAKHKYVLISGVRGIGKTSFLNYWLTEKTKYLENNNKTWFRIDASKVLDIWKDSRYYKERVGDLYLNYFRIHTVFVVLMYGGAFKDTVVTDNDIDGQSELLSKIVKGLINTSNRKLADTISIFQIYYKRLKQAEKRKIDNSRFLIRLLLVNSDSSGRDTILDLYEEITKLTRNNNINCLVFLDGIDNLSWTKRDAFYQSSCINIGSVIGKIKFDLGSDSSFIVAARPETIFELNINEKGVLEGFNDSIGDQSIYECSIVPPNIIEIINKKISAARNGEGFGNQKKKTIAETGIQEKQLNGILDEMDLYANKYRDNIFTVIKDQYSKYSTEYRRAGGVSTSTTSLSVDKINVENALKLLFDDDVRAFVDNYIKVFFINKMFAEKNVRGASLPDRVIVYMFLNGRPFIDSRDHYKTGGGFTSRANYNDRGHVFPNIFWYDCKESVKENPTKWHGLAGLRFLQLAMVTNTFVTGDHIHLMERLFGYNREVLFEILESFLAYGLIDVNNASRQAFFFEETKKDNELIKYSNNCIITEKGKFICDYIWMRPDILYYYALDTPMHQAYVMDHSRRVRECRSFEELESIDDFFAAAIQTLATFFLHVKHYTKEEADKIVNLDNDGSSKIDEYFGDRKTLLSAIQLPAYCDDALREFVEIGVSDDRESQIVRKIKNEIISLLQT